MSFTQRRPLFFLYLTVFINMVGFGMVFPLLPFYAQEFGASPLEIGLLAASFSLVQFLTSPFLGRISDRFGRKPVLFGGLLVGTFSMLLTGTANSLGQLFFARSLHGAVSAAILPTARAYMADITTPQARVAGMGKVGAAFALGFLIGPAFGSFLAALGGVHFPFFVSAAIAFFNGLSVFLFLPESLTQKAEKFVIQEGFFNVFKIFKHLRGEQGILFAVLFTWSFALSNNPVSLPLLVEERFQLGVKEIGYIFTLMALISALVQGIFLSRIVKVFGEKGTIFWGMLVQGAGLVLAAVFTNFSFFVASFMVTSFGSALNRPTAEGIISRLEKSEQGTILGVANSFESLGRVFGPLSAGFLYGFAPAFPFLAATVFLWLVALYLQFLPRLNRHR